MTTPRWWKEDVVYQIYPKSFKDSNNDGIGDIEGIIEKLDYIENLGINTIWICPIYQSPMIDNGYDVADYFEIHQQFGSMASLKKLIDSATKKNIKILLDLVVNHTSDEHIWFQKALKDKNSKYRDYYIFKSTDSDALPNNWRSIFGGSVWEKVPNEDSTFYYHTFDKKQPDLNWENKALRKEIYDMINWWLKQGISGFRVDAITFIKKDQDFSDSEVDGNDGLSSCKYKTRNRPGIDKFLSELNHYTFNQFNCVTVGEAPGVPYEEFNQYIGENGYFNMIFDFKYADIDVLSGSDWFKRSNWTIKEWKKKIFDSQVALQNAGWGANFIENHDQPRSISKFIKDKAFQNEIGAKALANMYFFLRGTPYIYQGQEIGMTNFERAQIEEFDDVSSIDNYYRSIQEGFSKEDALNFVNLRSRDNSRTPMQWNQEQFGGFSTEIPWLKLADVNLRANVESQLNNNNSLFHFYKKMIHLRNNSAYKEILIYGKFIPVETEDDIIAYQRTFKDKKIICATNFSNVTKKLDIDFKETEVLINNYDEYTLINNQIELKPYQTLLMKEGN